MESKYPLVIIEALDWSWYEGECDPRTHDFAPIAALVAGFLVADRDDCVVVCIDQFPATKRIRDMTTIPKSAIQRMHVIFLPEEWQDDA